MEKKNSMGRASAKQTGSDSHKTRAVDIRVTVNMRSCAMH